jgi:ribonuclease R
MAWPSVDLLPGIVIANAEGYGFMRPDAPGEDLYLSPAQMRKVLHGDRVRSVVESGRHGRRQGAIVEVLDRRSRRAWSAIVVQDGTMLVVPDDKRVHQDLRLQAPAKARRRGADCGRWKSCPAAGAASWSVGRILQRAPVSASRRRWSCRWRSASHNIPNEWPAETARSIDISNPQARRKSFRSLILRLYAAGRPMLGARDFDDAVFAEPAFRMPKVSA